MGKLEGNYVSISLSIFILYLYYVVVVIGVTTCDTSQQYGQRQALMDFYDATHGQYWRNNSGWGELSDVCSWFGISCTDGQVSLM